MCSNQIDDTHIVYLFPSFTEISFTNCEETFAIYDLETRPLKLATDFLVTY